MLTATGCGAGTVDVALPQPDGAVAAACARLVDYLPASLDGHRSRVVRPRSPLTHAWGSPPIVMRCGVPRPAGYSPLSPQTATVDGITWFQQLGHDQVRWTAIRQQAYVELVVPTSYSAQGGLLAELAPALHRIR